MAHKDLVVLPLLGAVLVEHPVDLSATFLSATLFICLGGAWFLGQVMHACGQRCMYRLFKSQGGRPAIRILRHGDNTLDPIIKRAWHVKLTKHSGIRFPTLPEEQQDPATADATYERAVAFCERGTLDRIAFPGLCQEWAECEFLTNGLALRWLGLITAVAAVLWSCFECSSLTIGLRPRLELVASMSLHVQSCVVIGGSALMALAWLFFFTPGRARAAAASFDLHLLETRIRTPARSAGIAKHPL